VLDVIVLAMVKRDMESPLLCQAG